MTSCQCKGIENMFDDRMARRELKQYQKNGPSKETKTLIETLLAQGVADLTALDIGAGVGAIHLALLDAGSSSATDVDASTAYLRAAEMEASRRGFADRVTHIHGNFVDVAADLPTADVVTLDRVICCYDDMHSLVERSSAKAQRYYGVVYPVDVWWTRLLGKVANFMLQITRNPFRLFVHPANAVESVIVRGGFQRISYRAMGFWQVIVYARNDAAPV